MAHPQRVVSLSEKGKFILDCLLHEHTHAHTHTNTHTVPEVGCGEVREGTAICKSICCLQISFLLRDSESHNSLAFPGQVPSAMAVEGLRKATYPDMCVNGSEDRERVCVMLNNITS